MKIDSVFFKSFENNEIVIKVGADGEPWRLVVMPLSSTKNKKFWSKLKKLTEEASINPNDRSKYTCLVCGARKDTFLRRYADKWFCGFCGTHYRIVDNKLVIVAKIVV